MREEKLTDVPFMAVEANELGDALLKKAKCLQEA